VSADLTGARALVTGAGHGIGRAIAVALAEAGADVAVHYGQSAEGAEQTAAAITALGRRAKTFAGDVRDAAQVNAFVADAVEFLGGLDVLVTNAGHLIGRSKVAEMTDEHWHNVIDVNLTSTFLTCRAALPSLVESGGRIVTMASVASHNGGGPGAVAYGAAKAGVVGFTKALAKEVGPKGIDSGLDAGRRASRPREGDWHRLGRWYIEKKCESPAPARQRRRSLATNWLVSVRDRSGSALRPSANWRI